MPELKKCPKCKIKDGEGVKIYNPYCDEVVITVPNLVYGVKFLCLKCDSIYENVMFNDYEVDLPNGLFRNGPRQYP